MDTTLAAEEFPGLYRAILDGVAELERIGRRPEAHRIRRAATRAYSGPWGDAGHRRLTALIARIERTLAEPGGAPQWRPGTRRIAAAPAVLALVRRLPTTR